MERGVGGSSRPLLIYPSDSAPSDNPPPPLHRPLTQDTEKGWGWGQAAGHIFPPLIININLKVLSSEMDPAEIRLIR